MSFLPEFYQPAFKHKQLDIWESKTALEIPILFLQPKATHTQLRPAFFGIGIIYLMNFEINSW